MALQYEQQKAMSKFALYSYTKSYSSFLVELHFEKMVSSIVASR